ncbi:MAG: NAD kinase [Pseudomonadota bacterium]
MAFEKLSIVASEAADAQVSCAALRACYGHVPPEEADVIVALGGDGFMLQTLHESMGSGTPVYGMNRGTVGFLMNGFASEGLRERLAAARMAEISPLRMITQGARPGGADDCREALAINEVALLRETRQAARIRVLIDGEEMLADLTCDGVMVATPAGSTAYNFSAHGPIIPIRARLLALTPVAVFRPRRWRGALLPYEAHVRFEILEQEKRPVSATADHTEVRDVASVDISLAEDIVLRLLYDPGHSLEERIVREQFAV